MNIELMSTISLFVSIAFLFFFALRGVHIIILAPLAGLIVALMSGINILEALTKLYMSGFINYASKFYLIFVLASIFAKYMDDSGAVRSMAKGILRVIGKESQLKVLFSLFLILGLLTYGGVNLFSVVFLAVALAIPLFKELNIPWHIFIGVLGTGIGGITISMLPGSPQVNNIIPTKYLGTDLMAAPTVGIVAAIACFAFNFWYLNRELKKAKAKQESFEMPNIALGKLPGEDQKNEPPIWLSVLPPILLLVLLNVVKIDVVYALIIAVLFSALIFFNRIKSHLQTLNSGALNSVTPVINVSADVGFGAVVAATAGFLIVKNALLSIPGHPVIAAGVAVNLCAGITGSSSGGLAIAMEMLGKSLLATGIHPELLHRIATIASVGLDSLPHSGGIIMSLAVCGLTHKQAYRHFFFCNIVGTTVALIAGMFVGILIY